MKAEDRICSDTRNRHAAAVAQYRREQRAPGGWGAAVVKPVYFDSKEDLYRFLKAEGYERYYSLFFRQLGQTREILAPRQENRVWEDVRYQLLLDGEYPENKQASCPVCLGACEECQYAS